MHSVQQALLSPNAFNLISDLIQQFDDYESNTINAKGLLFLKMTGVVSCNIRLNHTELYLIRDTLSRIAKQARTTAIAHLQALQAEKLLELLTLSTTTSSVESTAKTGKFVCIEGIKHGNRFYTSNSDSDPTKLSNGETAYKVLGFANTSEEAQRILGIS
jgi:hypothetical protein